MMTLMKRGPHRMALSSSTRRRWRGLLLDWAGAGGASRCSLAFLAMDSRRVSHSVSRFIRASWLQAMTSNLSSLPTILGVSLRYCQ